MAGEAFYPAEDVLDDIIEHLAVLLWDDDEEIDIAVGDPEFAGEGSDELDGSIELCGYGVDLCVEGVEAGPCLLVFSLNFFSNADHLLGN
jgi:hypothetical protein